MESILLHLIPAFAYMGLFCLAHPALQAKHALRQGIALLLLVALGSHAYVLSLSMFGQGHFEFGLFNALSRRYR